MGYEIIEYAEYAEGGVGEPRDIVALTSAHLRRDLRPGDLVERAGYARPGSRVVRVVRDGRVVATIRYLGAGGIRLHEEATCGEFD